MDDYSSGTYHPHLEDCYFCHCKWTENNRPIGWFEHYICSACSIEMQNLKTYKVP